MPKKMASNGSLGESRKFRTAGTRPDIVTSGLMNNNNNIMVVDEKAGSPISLKGLDNDSPRRIVTKEQIMTRTSGFDSDEQLDFDGDERDYSVGTFDRWLCNCEICNDQT